MSEKGWIRVPPRSGIWKAEHPGDSLEGKYIKKEQDSFRGRQNWKYCVESEHPCNINRKVMFYGTSGLNSAMNDIPTGYMIRIIYKKTHPNPAPKKQGFQEYEVYVWMDTEDPLYTKLYPQKNVPELKEVEDPEAKNTVENYVEIYKSENYNKKPTAEDLIKIAETDPDLSPEDLSRVKAEVASQIKTGQIKNGGEIK